MTKKGKKDRVPANGRLLSGGRLWDRKGNEWTTDFAEIERSEIEALLQSGDVEMAISDCGGPLRWFDGSERIEAWRNEVGPNFDDVSDWRPPRDAPGQLPYSARVWRRGDATLILFF